MTSTHCTENVCVCASLRNYKTRFSVSVANVFITNREVAHCNAWEHATVAPSRAVKEVDQRIVAVPTVVGAMLGQHEGVKQSELQ